MRRRREFLGGLSLTAATLAAGCLGGRGAEATTEATPDLPQPVLGDPDADVTVAVYEDFSCPHCATYNDEVFPQLRDAYIDPGTVRYEHHDFPIPVDDWSWPVASAARAVQDRQGDESFFAYAKRLFPNAGLYTMDLIAGLAAEVGADPDAVRTAAEEETYRPVVEADREAGIERGVDATPTVFVQDEPVNTPGFTTIRAAIEAEL
jgi:protein-disulfide isomerase